MEVQMKLAPFMSELYSLETAFLRIPVLFSYENNDSTFVYTINGGMPIIGKSSVETQKIEYFIGEVCTMEQLMRFIEDLNRNISTSIVFSENNDVINSIEFNPVNNTWTHRNGSQTGCSLTLKLSQQSLQQFKKSLIDYKKLASMAIFGHMHMIESENQL